MKKYQKKRAAAIATGRVLFEEKGAPMAGILAAKAYLDAERRGSHLEGYPYDPLKGERPGNIIRSLNPPVRGCVHKRSEDGTVNCFRCGCYNTCSETTPDEMYPAECNGYACSAPDCDEE